MLPPCAMMTPSAPDFGTSTSAVIEYDLFLIDDDRVLGQPAHAAEQDLRVALDQLRPAGEVRVEALERPIVERQHAVLGRLDQEEPLQLGELLRVLLRQVASTASSRCWCRRAPRRPRRSARL